LGYGIKGVIYILMGLLAFQGATGKNHTPADQLVAMCDQQTALWQGYAMDCAHWSDFYGMGLIRAFLDPSIKERT